MTLPGRGAQAAGGVLIIALGLVGFLLKEQRGHDAHAVAQAAEALQLLRKDISDLTLEVGKHHSTSDLYVRQIEQHGVDIHNLQTRASARPDAFTGEDGKELRKEIEARLARCAQRIADIEGALALQKYRMDKLDKSWHKIE